MHTYLNTHNTDNTNNSNTNNNPLHVIVSDNSLPAGDVNPSALRSGSVPGLSWRRWHRNRVRVIGRVPDICYG